MSHPGPLDPSSFISSYPSQLPPQQYQHPSQLPPQQYPQQAYGSGYGSPFHSQESIYPPGAYPSQLPPQQYPQQQYQSPQQYPQQQHPSQLPPQQYQQQYPSQLPPQQFSGYSPNPYAPNSPNPYFNTQPQEQQAVYDVNAVPVSVPYKIYWNTLAGIGAGLMERGDKALNSGFPVYEINLNYIDTVFAGKKQPWNTKYDNAIKIFGPGIQSKLVRGTIKVQHTALYSASLQNEKGVITSGNDLLEKVLHYGWREGRYYFYTYVIVGGKWRFSETGLSTLKDMISKHAMHANCARDVIYAGEFHVQRTPDGNNYKLIIDNNSGTFAPDLNDLPKLEQLFRKNFPGLLVEAYDRADPRLKAYVETIKAFNNSLIGQGGRN